MESNWCKTKDSVKLDVTILFNSKAKVYVSKAESGIGNVKLYDGEDIIYINKFNNLKINEIIDIKEAYDYIND
ncbi:hypothetical protein KPL38_18215 [Clostridium psychrophilum]|nr:hypothetical protein [Clostridium psychrophilum]